MRIEFLGFIPALIIVSFILKDAVENWEYSVLNFILRLILFFGFILITILGLAWGISGFN